ncbi:hypothetical protein FNV43_RR19008 [Rhamnella rubrinervis]|uniref:Uncharacterized protein n=1 Tax=Rhamnella rubrinervis TaxID=2594499 RepID=A0A8K0EBR8_9ROSA|nr:hypothetical protein FNV43_RR19008 [Rhamnella rubrinervis]
MDKGDGEDFHVNDMLSDSKVVLQLGTYAEVLERVQIIAKDDSVTETKSVTIEKKSWNNKKRKKYRRKSGEKSTSLECLEAPKEQKLTQGQVYILIHGEVEKDPYVIASMVRLGNLKHLLDRIHDIWLRGVIEVQLMKKVPLGSPSPPHPTSIQCLASNVQVYLMDACPYEEAHHARVKRANEKEFGDRRDPSQVTSIVVGVHVVKATPTIASFFQPYLCPPLILDSNYTFPLIRAMLLGFYS